MGSYNISCFVSRITIGPQDPIYMIPLLKNPHFANHNYNMIEQHDMYLPATLPIEGVYADYGNIEPIKSQHTNHLESHFQKEIDTIQDLEAGLFDSACYVHKDIFDAVCSIHKCDYSGRDTESYGKSVYEDFQDKIKSKINSEQEMKGYAQAQLEENLNAESVAFAKQDLLEIEETLLNPASQVLDFGLASMWDFKKMQEIYQGTFHLETFKQEIIAWIDFHCNLYQFSIGYTPSLMGQQQGNPFALQELMYSVDALNSKKVENLLSQD